MTYGRIAAGILVLSYGIGLAFLGVGIWCALYSSGNLAAIYIPMGLITSGVMVYLTRRSMAVDLLRNDDRITADLKIVAQEIGLGLSARERVALLIAFFIALIGVGLVLFLDINLFLTISKVSLWNSPLPDGRV